MSFRCYHTFIFEIEVAYFISTFFDVAGTEEKEGKENMPKEEISCVSILGHAVKNRMTVIRETDGALSAGSISVYIYSPAPCALAFLCVLHETNLEGKLWQFLKERAWLL